MKIIPVTNPRTPRPLKANDFLSLELKLRRRVSQHTYSHMTKRSKIQLGHGNSAPLNTTGSKFQTQNQVTTQQSSQKKNCAITSNSKLPRYIRTPTTPKEAPKQRSHMSPNDPTPASPQKKSSLVSRGDLLIYLHNLSTAPQQTSLHAPQHDDSTARNPKKALPSSPASNSRKFPHRAVALS